MSAGKIAFIAATAGDRKSSVETTSTTAKAVASMTPSAEGSVAHQVVASALDLADPAVALGQLSSVVQTLEPRLVDPADPTLSQAEWFRLTGEARFAILHRDNGGDGVPIAAWFAEVLNHSLGVAYWVVLTGSVGHLREEWTGAKFRSRSGSGTGAVFDAFAAVTGVEMDAQNLDENELFWASSAMSGMAPHSHAIRTVAEVKHVWASNGRVRYTSSGPDRLPVARVVVASPLYVETYRPRAENSAPTPTGLVSGKPSRWLAALAWLGI